VFELATGKVRHTLAGQAAPVTLLAFSADGTTLFSAAWDASVIVWRLRPAALADSLARAELDQMWEALGGDAEGAYKSIRKFAAAGKQGAAFLKDHVPPLTGVDKKKIETLIADLDSDDFETRKGATETLERLGEMVEPALRRAQESKPSLETSKRLDALLQLLGSSTLSGSQVRDLRALEALELGGSEDAEEVLQAIAKGAEGARLTREAKAALDRRRR
jgi:hypothetical protein